MKALITVIGMDKVGIIAGVCTLLAQNEINILDINQTVMDRYFTMNMLVDISKVQNFDAVSDALTQKGQEIGVSIRIQREEIFLAMHQI